MEVEWINPKSAVPVLWWRSVGHSHSAYVMETMIDELATLGKEGPCRIQARPAAARSARTGGRQACKGQVQLGSVAAEGPVALPWKSGTRQRAADTSLAA
jgi:CO/xanthine dehydrogenase Mo-binding subunit